MNDAKSLTIALKGKWYGRYGVARCPAHDDRRPSLSLSDGDDGKLLLHCKTGCEFRDVVAALRLRGLLSSSPSSAPSRRNNRRRKNEEVERIRKMAKQARACWEAALPITGSIAETYLRNRGIVCQLPETLRFHPEAWHPTGRRVPAMIARVDGLPRMAVHRTYLDPANRGKTSLSPQKAMLGATQGGSVRLSAVEGPLVVAEGIETALSLGCGLLRQTSTIWAALSASGIASLCLPAQPGQLIIATDGDPVGQGAGRTLGLRAIALGWSVSMLTAPAGKDWNDVLNEGGLTDDHRS